MRRRVALLSMAVGIVAAGNARAHDATQVIYDLSAMEPARVTSSTPRSVHEVALPTTQLPLSNPSFEPGSDELLGDLELRRQPGPGVIGVGVGSPRQGEQPGGNQDPSPTPEPGSMLLLGGALAAGARRFARRRSA